MALTSPGVEVTVIDESFYTPAAPGTVPLIVVATAQDKINAAGTGTAQATLASNFGNVYKVTSQKELVDLFGVPFFEKTASSTPIHGSERNEYGLLAAYSLLGVSNAAFIVRANVDLAELEGTAEAPGANPDDGTWWVDTQNTAWGINEWNGAAVTTSGGQKFTPKTPIVLTDDDSAKINPNNGVPLSSVGAIGDYAVVFETVGSDADFTASKETARVYYKAGITNLGVTAGDWVLVGSQEWAAAHPAFTGNTITSTFSTTDTNSSGSTVDTTGTFNINGTQISVTQSDTLDDLVADINGKLVVNPELQDGTNIVGVFAKNVNEKLYLFTNARNDSAGDSTLSNSIVITGLTNSDLANKLGLVNDGIYYGPKLVQSPHTQIPAFKRGDLDDEGDDIMTLGRPTGSVWIKTTEPNFGSRWRVRKWDAATTSWVAYEAPIYASGHSALYYLDRAGGGLNIPVDQLFVQSNSDEHSKYDDTPSTATFRVWRRNSTGNTVIESNVVTTGSFTNGTSYSFTLYESLKSTLVLSDARDLNGVFTGTSSGTTVSFTAAGTSADADTLAGAINSAGLINIEAAVVTTGTQKTVQIFHKLGGDFRIIDGSSGTGIAGAIFTPFNIEEGSGTENFYNLTVGSATDGSGPLAAGATEHYLASNWQPLAVSDFYASSNDPTNEPEDGTLWYNPEFSEVDIMIHDGNNWVGYQNYSTAYEDCDPDGPIVSASQPTKQSDGTDLVDGDLWISTADLENFPTIYRWNGLLLEWVQIDKTDQVTEEGVLFADARWDLDGTTKIAASIVDLLTSDYLDPDAPDPALYPKGMLLWNTRRSGGNVKRYINNYIDTTADNTRYDPANSGGQSMANYETDRWVTASPNAEDGSGQFGRKAQRSVVIQAMKSVIDTNDQIRDEERRNFNLIAAPGYPEAMSNLVNLNIDRGLTAFVIGDTPLRLAADATTLTNWGTNANLVTDNGDDGIVTYDEYLAAFYPNGFTTDLGGANAVVPASHMMLRTIALSDNVSYPWFAPAGTRRGGITNATAVGYIDSLSGEFQTVALNEGQRDTLYDLKVNPIPFFNGVGLVNYGQKTRARNASALDRINVARLVVYLRTQLNRLARPYIFEPNDKITRDEVKQACESLLLELVGLRALYDFAVVCDETNNTPARIDRNELWVDIAIEPVKAVEFIYIPLRVKNTGEI